MALKDRELRLIVGDHDAQYPVIVAPVWTQVQELTAQDPAFGDAFGVSVSVDGDTVLVGSVKTNLPGAAYVFVRSGAGWALQQELVASDSTIQDGFGDAVSLSGDTALIAATSKNSRSGAVYVFERSQGAWTQQQVLTVPDANGSEFGATLSVSGNTAFIGTAFGNTVYVFVRNGGVWTEQQEFTNPNSFGFGRISVGGNTAIIGSGGADGGTAYVFVENGGVWSQQQILSASDATSNNWFGSSVSLSGDTALIGSSRQNGKGSAYVFVRNGGNWTQQQELSAPDGVTGDFFGLSVFLSRVRRAIPCSANGREVIASACLSGIPSRMKTVHQL